MPNVENAFREFLVQLTTPRNESDAAKNHRASIEARLRNDFGLEAFFQSGSFGAGTNIPVFSDVDRFAVFPRNSIPENGIGSLRAVLRALRRRFPQTRTIKIDPPAIVIPFGQDGLETTEIIPAIFEGLHDGERIYAIPDPKGGQGWTLSAPRALRDHINLIDGQNHGQLKPLIRLLKCWKYEKNVPIQSIYLELFCADFAQRQKLITPSFDIVRIINFLRHSRLQPITPPIDLNNDIPSTKRQGQREVALGKIANWSKVSVRALEAEAEWRLPAVSKFWTRFFGRPFPTLE